MNKKYILTLTSVLILSIVALLSAYLFYKRTVQIESEISTLHSEVQSLSVQANRVVNLRQATHSTEDDLKKIQTYFITKDGALDFVKYVETLAVSTGLVFKIDTVDEVVDPVLEPYNKSLLKLSIRSTGSLSKVETFLSLIESLPYNTRIHRVDLRRSGVDWTLVLDIGIVKEMEK